MGLQLVLSQKGRRSVSAPNKACTRLGVRTAFFRQFSELEARSGKAAFSHPTQAGNAHRWALTSDLS
jgi:hypothetical protein